MLRALFAFTLFWMIYADQSRLPETTNAHYYLVLADRSLDVPVIGWVGDHTAIELWKTNTKLDLNQEYSFSVLNKIEVLHTVELVDSETWQEWRGKPFGKEFQDSARTVSVITFDTRQVATDDDFTAVDTFTDLNTALQRWQQLCDLAKIYPFAEQPGFDGFTVNWPASTYQVLGNNCNTFTQWLLAQSGYSWLNMSGNHAGNALPQSIDNPTYYVQN